MSRKVTNFQKKFPSRFVDNYGEHDDREEQFLRRVTVNQNQGRIGRKKNYRKMQVHMRDGLQYVEDDSMDERMAGGSMQGNFRGGRGRGRGRGGRIFGAAVSAAQIKRSYWYQIIVVNGSRYGRQEVLSCLTAFVQPQTFFPVCYQIVRSDSEFYVETWATAQMLLACTRKIHMSDGQPLVLRIKDTKPPFTPIDEVACNKIKQAMAKRYVADNKALDLSRFVRDPEFVDGMFCALNRPPVLQAVVKIIKENIPDIVALNLTGNSIHDLDSAADEFKALKNLRILHLSENQIMSLNSLSLFKSMQITELVLERNPLCQSFADRSHFVSELRKRFPKLRKLDDTELLAEVTFDVGDEGALPTPLAACICVPEGRDFVTAFLSQYYKIYDSDNRVELTQAYAETAAFSLIANYPPYSSNSTSSPRLNAYFSESRNLLRIADFPRRKNKLRLGRDNVVDFLYKQMPKTQHDLPSFLVDLTFFMPELIQLSVAGIFRETGVGSSSSWPLRYFSRTFLIVAVGSGFCIANDMLYVSNCTEAQREVAFKVEPEKPVAAVQSPVSPAVPVSPLAGAGAVVPDDNVKLQMVQAVAQQTGMNLDWSRKCLEETEWDFQRAAFTFNELQKRGGIPAEAFIK